MKDHLFKFIVGLLLILAIGFASILVIVANTFSAYKGEIPGTGFINQELSGTCSSLFDVDSKGKIYFVIDKMFGEYVTVYDSNGVYLYTLDVNLAVISVRIDNNDNITVYGAKADVINVYNQKGQLINTINDKANKYYSKYFNESDIKKPDGSLYKTDVFTLTKTINGKTTVLYTKPLWQILDEASFGFLILTIVLIAITCWIKYALPIAIQRAYGSKHFLKQNRK